MPSQTYTHDVIVIGAGAAGLTAAGGCALFGLKVALVERGAFGGECLNNGCVPSKALIAAARRAYEAKRGARFGVSVEGARVDWAGVREHVEASIATIAPHDDPKRFEEMGCEVFRGEARLTGPREVEVAGQRLAAPRIVLALGSEPALPPIEGLAAVPCLTNENLFQLDRLPEHLIVLGGGAVGMEMAQAFCRLGAAVTLIERGEILSRDDRESAAMAKAALEADGVRFVSGTAVRATGGEGAVALTLEGGTVIEGSHVLVATGRKARGQGMGLEELGVQFGANGIAVDDRRRTSLKHIYAIGDCREGPRLTHVAGYEGSNVALEISLGVPTKVDWTALPWCTYTAPEVGQVGLTEAEARAKFGDKVRIVREEFSHNDRAVTEGAVEGQLKLVMKGRKLVGASVCGEGAGDMLLPLAQTISGKAGTFALGSAIIAYPTRGEITKAGAFAAWEPLVFSTPVKRIARALAALRRRFG
ncbi:FAD-binding protein [Aurantiacibacter xanthus]|uniref:FAD-binding protein n=1 Tax=Aurantiacibacter xanthus TaxID=1784712 RepID=A0A3A1NZY1_9SPHN|nr:FAD-dependent oxidoreductase [Aurantiacibacter xanthus]RIV81637.1 FAD-binding protein [Aurantiacibacter xanthus]